MRPLAVSSPCSRRRVRAIAAGRSRSDIVDCKHPCCLTGSVSSATLAVPPPRSDSPPRPDMDDCGHMPRPAIRRSDAGRSRDGGGRGGARRGRCLAKCRGPGGSLARGCRGGSGSGPQRLSGLRPVQARPEAGEQRGLVRCRLRQPLRDRARLRGASRAATRRRRAAAASISRSTISATIRRATPMPA